MYWSYSHEVMNHVALSTLLVPALFCLKKAQSNMTVLDKILHAFLHAFGVRFYCVVSKFYFHVVLFITILSTHLLLSF